MQYAELQMLLVYQQEGLAACKICVIISSKSLILGHCAMEVCFLCLAPAIYVPVLPEDVQDVR